MIKCESCITTPNVEDREGSAEELGSPGEVLISGTIMPAGTYSWFQQPLCQILVGHQEKCYDCKNHSSMELTFLESGRHYWLEVFK